ncbi:MAG: DinB family protein [Thermomicrobiales bacterium]
MAVEQPNAGGPARQRLNALDLPVEDLDNDSLIVRLQMTVNHLSRWLTPITDKQLLMHSARRGEKSVFELLQELRDTEQVAFARMNAIANSINPDLDKLPDPRYFAEKDKPGFDRSPLSVLAQFRRLRQSTCALLRSLPDNAWKRVGTSRLEHDWQIRTLAEYLAENDTRILHLIDVQLHTTGVRQNINDVSGVHLTDLMTIYPVRQRIR